MDWASIRLVFPSWQGFWDSIPTYTPVQRRARLRTIPTLNGPTPPQSQMEGDPFLVLPMAETLAASALLFVTIPNALPGEGCSLTSCRFHTHLKRIQGGMEQGSFRIVFLSAQGFWDSTPTYTPFQPPARLRIPITPCHPPLQSHGLGLGQALSQSRSSCPQGFLFQGTKSSPPPGHGR